MTMTTITRRAALRRICTSVAVPLVAGGIMPLFTPTPEGAQAAQISQTANAAAAGPSLIVYYSRSGNTRTVAQHIQANLENINVDADLLEIQTVTPYPAEYRATTQQAKKELAEGYRPPLTTKVANMAQNGRIFVGSPNWWSSMAPPVMTFLSEYDFSGKTIAPFMTHGGGGLGHSVQDIRKLCPTATVVDAFAVNGDNAANAQEEVAAWLRRLALFTRESR